MATEREFLVKLGLANEGRGRFSAEAREALNKAKSEGMTFDKTAAEIAKEQRAAKPKKVASATPKVAREVRPSQDSYDAKAVRAWGESTGQIERGRRGKLPTALINAYLASNKVERKVPVQRSPSVRRSAVREETVGYTFARRGPKDAAFISEPLVAVVSCGRCARGVSYCGCDGGPTAPKYLGGEVLLLTRPTK